MCDVCRLPHKPCCLIRPFAFIIIIITIFVVIAIIIIIIVILFCFNGYFLCFYFEYDYIVYFIFWRKQNRETGTKFQKYKTPPDMLTRWQLKLILLCSVI